MSTELKTRIRDYAEHVERAQAAVDVDEILTRAQAVPTLRPPDVREPSRGPWPALTAAAVVAILFGLFVWLFPSSEPVPPADSTPSDIESTYYDTTAVPEGFALQDVRSLGGSHVLYVREFDGTWLPTDGAFAIDDPFVFQQPSGEPEDYINTILQMAPGSSYVEIGGRPGAILDREFSQDGVTAPLIWVVGYADGGGVYEISAIGMTHDQVLAIAAGVERISVDGFKELGSHVTWDAQSSAFITELSYEVPDEILEMATDVDVALGLDVLWPRLAYADQDTTVVTTEDGSIVESEGGPIRSSLATMFMEVEEGIEDFILVSFPDATLSPRLNDLWLDSYVEAVSGGSVLSEDPYVIQGAAGPEPRFDVSPLGTELPLVATSASAVPGMIYESPSNEGPAATEDRPVIVVGSAVQPDSETGPVTMVLWFTETGTMCEATISGSTLGSGCGAAPSSPFGITGESEGGTSSEVTYAVPLETSVVQIVTLDSNYWQRPIAGYGVVPYGDTVLRPTAFVAFDAAGREIGRW